MNGVGFWCHDFKCQSDRSQALSVFPSVARAGALADIRPLARISPVPDPSDRGSGEARAETGETALTYWGEFRTHWSNLVGACLGLALGSAIYHYMSNLLAPPMLRELGWSRAEFALTGSFGLLTMFFVPVAGRLVDRYGVRAGATVGFIAVVLGYLALSQMSGNIYEFYAIIFFKNLFGILTTTIVFTRVIIERFNLGRGMALSLLMSGAPIAGAALALPMRWLIATEGWRAGFLAMAALSAIAGIVSIALAGRGGARAAAPVKLTWSDFAALVRNPIFVLLIGGMFLCNVPQFLVGSQMSLMLMESGASENFGAEMLALYGLTVLIGRFITGIALDRISAQYVALFALGLPCLGYFALATPFDSRWLLAGSIALIGLAQGAEGDLGAYITSRRFPVAHYSMIYGFLIASLSLASSLGSLLLSATLAWRDSFAPFLGIAAIATLAGALSFYATGRGQVRQGAV